MADSPYIKNVTTENFEQVVLQGSFQTPVLLDFWAPWCGPCKSLGPILEKLVIEYRGAFVLAKLNTDEEQMLAGQLGIRSLPTVMLIKDGQQLDGFMGAQPESAVREMLQRHLGAGDDEEAEDENGDQRLSQAQKLLAAGRPDEAVALLQLLSADEPDNPDLQLLLGKALLQTGQTDEVEKILAGLPEEQQNSDAAKGLRAGLGFATALADAPDAATLQRRIEADPADLQARYQLGVRQLLDGDFENAMEQFFEIMKRDRAFGDDLGRRSLVDAFNLIEDPALTGRYRQRMASLLF
ncbi:MAG: thioredoxin [Candidatus Competibacterales bacterium]|nr:thioredoxin [Candidatus Competibacterales bacterium]